MRIVIAMMKHETNTFSPIVTDWDRFQQWGAYQGAAVQQIYEGTGMPVAAYMKLARARDAEIVTPIAAEAMPSGPVLEQAYEQSNGHRLVLSPYPPRGKVFRFHQLTAYRCCRPGRV